MEHLVCCQWHILCRLNILTGDVSVLKGLTSDLCASVSAFFNCHCFTCASQLSMWTRPERRRRGSCWWTPWRCWRAVAPSHLTRTPRRPLCTLLRPKATSKSWSEDRSALTASRLSSPNQMAFIQSLSSMDIAHPPPPSFRPSSGCCYSVGRTTWTAGTPTGGRPCTPELTGGRRRCAPCWLTTCAIWGPSTMRWVQKQTTIAQHKPLYKLKSFICGVTNDAPRMSL